jgi:hypothetical protein
MERCGLSRPGIDFEQEQDEVETEREPYVLLGVNNV